MNLIYCSIMGDEKIENKTEDFALGVESCLMDLIENKNVDYFIFSGESEFERMCYNIVSKLKKEKYYEIQRIFAVENLFKKPQWVLENRFEDVVALHLKFNFDGCEMQNIAIMEYADYAIFYRNPNCEVGFVSQAYEYAKAHKKDIILF